MPHVFDAVFHHYQPVNAAAKGKAGVFIRIDVSSLQYIRVDQAAANQLNPAFTATHLAAGVFAFAEGAAEGKLKAWLGEGKVEGIDPHIKLLAIVALQKFLQGGN